MWLKFCCRNYSNPNNSYTGNPKNKVIILERELTSAQAKIVQLEELARSLEMDKESLKNNVKEYQRELAEKEEQLNEIMGMRFFFNFQLTVI